MTQNVARLLHEALRLPESERGELAVHLIDSLDPGAEEGVEAAWSAEIQKRLEELRTGQVQAVPWPEARRLITDDADEPGETRGSPAGNS